MADYDISASYGFKNLYGGGWYSTGDMQFDARNYVTVHGLPQAIYFCPDGVLSTNTMDAFLSHNALSGKYNGVTYNATNYMPLVEMNYGNGKKLIWGVKGHIIGDNNYISQFTVERYDPDTMNVYGGAGYFSVPTRAKEDSRYIYFWLCDAYLPSAPQHRQYCGVGGKDSYGGSTYYLFDELTTQWLTHESFQWSYFGPWTQILVEDAVTIGGNTYTSEPDKIPSDSEEGGGGGNYDTTSDTVDFPTLPVLSAVGSGIMTLWNPSIPELVRFSNYLWSNDVFDTIKKFISSPMELIVSLAIVPVAPPIETTATNICIGGIDTEVSSHKLTNQYMTFDCGSINVNEYYGNALDYGVYTRISIYLPYIGVRELKSDEIMGGTIQVKYNVDLATGSCVALIKCTRQMLESVLYSFEGNLSAQIPLTSRDFSSMYASLARAVIDTAVTGGVGTAMDAVGSAMSVMSAKPNMTRSGSISSNGGHLGLHTPYLIIERPIQSLPSNAGQYYGYPSNMTAQLGTLSGYTEVEYLIETNIHCTDNEWEEINELLKEGVYL